jgi:Uma2 family endonuclease
MLRAVSTETLPADIPRRRFTVDEVSQMVEQGILGEDEHVELLDGELVVMSPQGPPHASRVMELHEALAEAYRGRAHVRSQVPLESRPHNLPEPDVALVRGQVRDYRTRHPTGRDTLLVIEVARTSQRIDRRKIAIYAAAGVPVYWLIDLAKSRVEVFRQPSADASYAQHLVLGVGDDVELPDLDVRWPVSDLVS